MPALKAQARFLMRGSALLAALLILWWFVLASPMLYVLREVGGMFLGIQENPSGDWTLHVPVEAIRTMPGQTAPQQIHSVDFDIPHSDAIAFTFSLPLYWAIVLAAPGWRRSLRPLLLGTAVMCAFELASLLVFCQVTAGSAVAEITGNQDAYGKWLRHFGQYLVENALPFIMPFVVALALHRGLRAAIFPWGKEPEVAAPSVRKNKKKRRGSRPAVRIHTKI